jgi:peroxiredoxin
LESGLPTIVKTWILLPDDRANKATQLVSLQQKLDDYNAKFRSSASVDEVMATDQGIRAAIESGQVLRACSAGVIAPWFELPDESGKGQSLDRLLRSGPLVLVVIRGSWCPFCRIELRELERVVGQIAAVGASLVVVTPETMESCRRVVRKNGLSFSLLSDIEGQLTRDLGLRRAVPPYARAWLEKNGIDLHTLNADKSWALPIPARFVVGRDRRIVYAEANADYRRRGEPEELIPVLERMALDSRP